MAEYGPTITQPAAGKHTATFIMLHGLGDTAEGWAPTGPVLNLPHVKMVFPTAPTQPITVDLGAGSGALLPGWFDIHGVGDAAFRAAMDGSLFDPKGEAASLAYAESLIAKELAAGTPANRIAVGGFSQAGYLALRTFLKHEPTLAGCVALSTWLNPQELEVLPAALSKPIFLAHGIPDDIIPFAIGEETRDVLVKAGCTDVEFKVYPDIKHETCTAEMDDLRAFLLRALPA